MTLEWSDADQSYVARVPALGSACYAHGDTASIAVQQAREAAVLILEVLTQQGDPIPAPDGVFPSADGE